MGEMSGAPCIKSLCRITSSKSKLADPLVRHMLLFSTALGLDSVGIQSLVALRLNVAEAGGPEREKPPALAGGVITKTFR